MAEVTVPLVQQTSLKSEKLNSNTFPPYNLNKKYSI